MIQKNTTDKGRKSTTSSAKPQKNAAGKKKFTAAKSPVKKQWANEKAGAADAIKKKDPPSGNDYQKARAGFGKGERPARVEERPVAESRLRKGVAAGESTPASNNPPRPGSFKTYRKNNKTRRDDSRSKGGAAPGKNTHGAKGEEARGNDGSQRAKGKGNPKRDAFSKRQSGAPKPTRFEKDREEQSFDNKVDRKPSTRQHKTGGAKPTDRKYSKAKTAKPAARKGPARPAAKRAPSKRRK